MVRFSCFNAHSHILKAKKPDASSMEAMQKTSQDSSHVQPSKMSLKKALSSKSLLMNSSKDAQFHDNTKGIYSSSSFQRGWKSEEIKCDLNFESDLSAPAASCIKKSQSLGSGLCNEERVLSENDVEAGDSPEPIGLIGLESCKEQRIGATDEHLDGAQSDSIQASSVLVHSESIFSIGDPQYSEKGPGNSDSPSYGEGGNESGSCTPTSPPIIVKSKSMPQIAPTSPTSDGCYDKYLVHQAGSSEDLHGLDLNWKEQGKQGDMYKEANNNNEYSIDDGYESYEPSKDWIMPASHEAKYSLEIVEESSFQLGEDFKSKRISEWVNSIENCTSVEESSELSDTNDELKKDLIALDGLTAMKAINKVSPGMEAAKRYISTLNASATTAQLCNHGLDVIPFLSAFVSLRILNLSGNSIARITAGALPRGLHVLNLSKNNITTIEGLRELTRLRVLNLSYNRILRIGHGLASCSSLKELYLAGNKISEVEGLHRLLKLTILDLRFNKISTAKCLGQLAANYNSLQAIRLEGNPAQKNVGDDQLKKSLQGLLPHMVYFNSQPIKACTLKDVTDRPVRLSMSAHQVDRGHRSDKKVVRKVSHSGVSGTRPSSSTHGRKVQAEGTRIRHVRPPPLPTGTKAIATNHSHDHFDVFSKLLSFRSGISMHRSRSEGTVGAP